MILYDWLDLLLDNEYEQHESAGSVHKQEDKQERESKKNKQDQDGR